MMDKETAGGPGIEEWNVAGQDQAMSWQAVPRAVIVGAAIVLPAVTCALFGLWRDEVTSATVALVLVVWVVAAAATGDRVAGIVAAFAGGLSFDFFLTVPYQTFTIADPEDVEVTVLLVLIGIAVTEVALWGRRQQARAARRSGYLDGVLSTAEAVAAGETPTPALIDVVSRQIVGVLGVDTCRYVSGPLHDARVAVLDHDGVLTRDGNPIDVDRHGLPVDEHVAILVRKGPRTLGHFIISAAAKLAYPTTEQRRVAVLLADQVASAVESTDATHYPRDGLV